MLKLKFQNFGHLMGRTDSLEKNPDVGKDWGQEEKGMTEDKMVEWHHRLNGHEFEQTPGDSEGQGGLVCCSAWGHKQSATTEWMNNKCSYCSWQCRPWAKLNNQWNRYPLSSSRAVFIHISTYCSYVNISSGAKVHCVLLISLCGIDIYHRQSF